VNENVWSRATAHGKVNLFFGVGALQLDGYHDVLSIYQALSLREDISVRFAFDESSIVVDGTLHEDQLLEVPLGESNLVAKAAKLIASLGGLEEPKLDFEIFKRVPVAGGMAGGSADAAAAMLAANQLLQTGFSSARLIEESVALGADVPFGLLGGTAVGTGRGEKLESLSLGTELHLVMIVNENGLSTPKVYAELDRQRESDGINTRELPAIPSPSALIDALASADIGAIAKHIHNDLEPAALALLPELELTIAAAERYGALRAFVSGSGPTVAALVETADDALALEMALRHANFDAFATSSTTHGARLLDDEGN
jgi:4-diphosphocytidyl-2-C-methyl-D-erythritol kinase